MVYIIKDSLPRLSNECDGLLGHLSHEGTDWVAFLLHLGTPQGEHVSSLPLVEFQGFIAECCFAEPTQSLRDMHILAPVQVTTQCMQFSPPPNKTLVQYVAASRDEDRFLLPRRLCPKISCFQRLFGQFIDFLCKYNVYTKSLSSISGSLGRDGLLSVWWCF